jgi:hypothetical protein
MERSTGHTMCLAAGAWNLTIRAGKPRFGDKEPG